MIPHHIKRNYLNRAWIQGIAKSGKKLPHFELVNGDLVFQGVVGLFASIKNEREVGNKEIELTSAFLSSMQKKVCRKGYSIYCCFTSDKPKKCLPTACS